MTKTRHSIYAAVYLVLEKDDKILLLRRYKTDWENGKYTLLAGHVDGNESISQAIIREAYEEAGIKIEPDDLKVVHTMHQISDKEYVDFYLKTNKWQGDPTIMELNKCDDMQWFPLEKLPSNILANVKAALALIKNNETFSEFKW